jgi:hypothetical protein
VLSWYPFHAAAESYSEAWSNNYRALDSRNLETIFMDITLLLGSEMGRIIAQAVSH